MEPAARCEICSKAPATTITLRRQQGMLVARRSFRDRPTVCRACGSRLLRSWTLKTIAQGWWGYISFFTNWVVLVSNLAAWLKLRRLPPATLSQL